MVKTYIVLFFIELGLFAFFEAIRQALVKYLDVFIPLTWWVVIPVIIVVIIFTYVFEGWIERGDVK